MRLCRFDNNRLGVVDGSVVRDVTAVLAKLSRCAYPLPRFDLLIDNLASLRSDINREIPRANALPLEEVVLLSPVANPGKIIAAPVNYVAHLDEAREDPQIHHDNRIDEIHRIGLFLKATSSIIGPGERISLRFPDRRTDHEVELVAVIGKRGRDISISQALSHVAGYCIGLDMTLRGPEDRSLRKSIDTYSVVGPWIVTADELSDPTNLDISISVNSNLRQQSNTQHLILSVSELIAFASTYYTLYPGDLVFTGTPQGVTAVRPGDRLLAEISLIGRMAVDIVAG